MISPKVNTKKILLLSDLHIGDSTGIDDFIIDHEKPLTIQDKSLFINSMNGVLKDYNLNAVFVSGDLTSKGKPSEIELFNKFIFKIADKNKIKHEDVIITFGNHDVDWAISDLTNINPNDTFSNDTYKKIASNICAQHLKNHATELGHIPGVRTFVSNNLEVYILNSGHLCFKEQDYPHGKLGEEQYRWFEEKIKTEKTKENWRILLLHHHINNHPYPIHKCDVSFLDEGPELYEIIGKYGFDIVLHGHRHHPYAITYNNSNWNKPVTFICAGSLSVGPSERCKGTIPNLFHIITLQERSQDNAAIGYIETFYYNYSKGWLRFDTGFSTEVPLDYKYHFGHLLSRAQNITELKAYFDKSIKFDDQIHELPKYQDLPVRLKCKPIIILNELIQEILNDKGYKIYGEYPGEVCAIKKVGK